MARELRKPKHCSSANQHGSFAQFSDEFLDNAERVFQTDKTVRECAEELGFEYRKFHDRIKEGRKSYREGVGTENACLYERIGARVEEKYAQEREIRQHAPRRNYKDRTRAQASFSMAMAEQICQLHAASVPMTHIADMVGVSRRSILNWLQWGQRDREAGRDTELAKFQERYAAVTAEDIARGMNRIIAAAEAGSWQAEQWRLKILYRKTFAEQPIVKQPAALPPSQTNLQINILNEDARKNLEAFFKQQREQFAAAGGVALPPGERVYEMDDDEDMMDDDFGEE